MIKFIKSAIACVTLLLLFTSCNSNEKSYEELELENEYLNNEVWSLQAEVDDLEKQVGYLKDDISSYEYYLSEYEESLVLIVEGSEEYHKCIDYCDVVKNSSFNQEEENVYKVYYFWTADAKGFEACPKCYK